MALNSENVQILISQLARDRQDFIKNTNKTNELLQQTLLSLQSLSAQPSTTAYLPQTANTYLPLTAPNVSTTPARKRRPSRTLTRASQRTTTADIEVEFTSREHSSSIATDSDDESDTSESIFVQTALQPEQYDLKGLTDHIRNHKWTDGGRAMLCGLNDDHSELERPCLLPITREEAEADRSNLSHSSIYDVGFDGVPLDIRYPEERAPTRALDIWRQICSTNTDPKRRPAAGKIVIVREPSPKLFAALHYTMHKHFDTDELFDLLEHEDPGLMFPHRAFDQDTRRRRSFVIVMEYFTIVGDMCKPMPWQSSDANPPEDRLDNHIPISRCTSVIALSLEGPPMTQVRNRDRRIDQKYGDVFDPFSPWRVLSIQAYPDWHATMDTHTPANHYVNGPEAFLYTLEAEFKDARKRLKEVYNRVGELVEPPSNFIFNERVREKLLFEDDKFTYSKKYFWAYQTLSIINQDIVEMIESYKDCFRDSVWEGTNKIIWPGESGTSSRFDHWRKRMAKLRRRLDDEVEKLGYIKSLNVKKMQDIEALRENLFSGTSVMEARRSVKQTQVTIEQNRSVLLLTLVTIFFLPLTFVTSVFGMTNMSPSEPFLHFAWTSIAVCIPTYLFIGSMHTDAGLAFWSHQKQVLFTALALWLARCLAIIGYVPGWAEAYVHRNGGNVPAGEGAVTATSIATGNRPLNEMAMNMRLRQLSVSSVDDRARPSAVLSNTQIVDNVSHRRERSPWARQPSEDVSNSSLNQRPSTLLSPQPPPPALATRRNRSNSVSFSSDKLIHVHDAMIKEDSESLASLRDTHGIKQSSENDMSRERDVSTRNSPIVSAVFSMAGEGQTPDHPTPSKARPIRDYIAPLYRWRRREGYGSDRHHDHASVA